MAYTKQRTGRQARECDVSTSLNKSEGVGSQEGTGGAFKVDCGGRDAGLIRSEESREPGHRRQRAECSVVRAVANYVNSCQAQDQRAWPLRLRWVECRARSHRAGEQDKSGLPVLRGGAKFVNRSETKPEVPSTLTAPGSPPPAPDPRSLMECSVEAGCCGIRREPSKGRESGEVGGSGMVLPKYRSSSPLTRSDAWHTFQLPTLPEPVPEVIGCP
jgi:hypothetical protein